MPGRFGLLRRPPTLVSLCVIGCLQPQAFAQDRPTQSFPARTDIITVDAVVLDDAGRPVRGLGKEEFTVLEDGQAQEITAFEARDLRAVPPPSEAAPAASTASADTSVRAPGRTLALIVDDIGGEYCVAAVEAVRHWIKEKADPRDRVSLFTASGRVQPAEERIATGASTLLRALDAIRCRPLPGASALRPLHDGGTGSILGPDADPNAIAASLRGKEVADALNSRARALVGTIETFSGGHVSERSRKTAIIFTESFIRDDTTKQTEQAIGLANRTNTALYFINPAGLVTQTFEAGVTLAGAAQMAAATGGALFSNNDVAGTLERTIDESEAYYLLGYTPRRAPDGRWRQLRVGVARPGLQVRARRGYLASIEPEAKPQRASSPTTFTPLAFQVPGNTRPGEMRLDGSAVAAAYGELVDRYRRSDPAKSPEGQRLISAALEWDVDLSRMAAKLAALPSPEADTVVRLDAEVQTASAGAGRAATARYARARDAQLDDPRSDDAMERAVAAARLLAADNRATDSTPSPRADRRPRLSSRLTRAPGAAPCLIAASARDCASALKAAALLHTDAATASLRRGDRTRAAAHRAIAGWLLWHLPASAADDSFVRDWVAAVGIELLGDGSLSSARQLGQLGLARFPNDPALLFSTAMATEAVASLCFRPDGDPVRGEDCDERPLAFDRPQPWRTQPAGGQPSKHADVVRETERMLRILVQALPAAAEVHLRLGRALAERGQTDEALRELRSVVASSTNPNLTTLAHLLLSRLAETRGDAGGAVEHARAARGLAPESQSARMALASALLASGDRRGAAEVIADLPTTPRGVEDLWPQFLLGSTVLFGPARAALYARVSLP